MSNIDTGFLREIWKGAYFLDNEHYNSICSNFITNLLKDLTKAKVNYEKCENNLDRIKTFKEYFEWEPIPEKYFKRFRKSSEISTALREAGNIAYKALDISNAFRGYNLALAFAPNETEQLGLAFANRSALFLFINEPHLAARDLTLALKYNKYEANLQKKLIQREAKCELAIIKLEREKENLNNFFPNKEEEGRKFCEEKFLKLNSTNQNLKYAEDFVQVLFNPECGRRLVATKDIPAGRSCLVEEPFATSLEKMLNWDTEHCAFCTKPFLGGLPSPISTFGLYCDESCVRKASEGVYKYEPNFLPYFHSTEALHGNEILLIVGILMKVGASVLYKHFLNDGLTCYKRKEEEKKFPNRIAGFDEKSFYDSNSYTSVYHLVSHKTLFNFDSLLQPIPNSIQSIPNEFKSLMIPYILDQSTSFFSQENFPQETKKDFQDFLSSLILTHFENLQYNILSLSEWTTPNLGPLSLSLWNQKAKSLSKNPKTSAYAIGVFPLIALCNHSCDPNAIFVKCTKLDKACILTSRRIQAGEEILISYKAPFTRINYKDRQNYLLENYKFECKCYACVRQYSMESTQLDPIEIQTSCPSCKGLDGAKKLELLCSNCKVKIERISSFGLRLEEAQELIRKERYPQAFELLVKEADFMSLYFEANFSGFQVCQDLIRRTVVHLIHL